MILYMLQRAKVFMHMLTFTWNYQTHFWRHKLLTEPSVLHFTGPEKPWNANTEYNEYYYYYLNLPIEKLKGYKEEAWSYLI